MVISFLASAMENKMVVKQNMKEESAVLVDNTFTRRFGKRSLKEILVCKKTQKLFEQTLRDNEKNRFNQLLDTYLEGDACLLKFL